MGLVPGRSKRLESVIGICLLAVLILTGVGIFIQQSKYDMSRFGVNVSVLPKPEVQSPQPETVFGSSPLAPAGFETLSKAERYDAETLYEKIDGKAPLYTEAGFKELTTQRFAETNDPNLWMEVYIYDMGDIKNAFCVYSVQKRAGAEVSKDLGLSFAYRTLNALYFVLDKYYIEIIGSAESCELFNAIAEMQEKLTTNLAVDRAAGIAELTIFPQENLVSDSFKLYTASAFGCDKLTNIFTARYKIESETVTAFVSKRADAKEAEATAESYRKFLTENGAVIKNTDNKVLVDKVMDSFGTTEIVFTAGPFVAGVHEAENQEAAERIAEELINRLKLLKKD